MGIGFAIPVSTAKQVLESIVKEGQVTRRLDRGGAERALARAGRDLRHQGHARRDHHRRAAERPGCAGRHPPGDVITNVAGKPVHDVSELLSQVAALKPGAASKFSLLAFKTSSWNSRWFLGWRPKPRRVQQ